MSFYPGDPLSGLLDPSPRIGFEPWIEEGISYDEFVAKNQSQGDPTFAGKGETWSGWLSQLGTWAQQGVAIYKNIKGANKDLPADQQKTTFAGLSTNAMIAIGVGLVLVTGLVLFLRRR